MTSNASLAQMSILWIFFWDEEVKAASNISQNWLYSLSFKATNDLEKWRGNDEEKKRLLRILLNLQLQMTRADLQASESHA